MWPYFEHFSVPFFILGNEKQLFRWKSLTNTNMNYSQISFTKFEIGSMLMTLASEYVCKTKELISAK